MIFTVLVVACTVPVLGAAATRAPNPSPTALPFANSCTSNFAGGARLPYVMCNMSAPAAARLDDIVARMTPLEKCMALGTDNPSIGRLGLPSLPGGEGLHGVASGCGAAANGSTGCPTSFPCPTALGAAFSTKLYQDVGAAIGREARALNNQGRAGIYLFTPNSKMLWANGCKTCGTKKTWCIS
eukprot:m.331020 g.331020  ORF g.331020 m.331020 type:complete len:184 (-) comp19769_c0_seq10:33-584(-)